MIGIKGSAEIIIAITDFLNLTLYQQGIYQI